MSEAYLYVIECVRLISYLSASDPPGNDRSGSRTDRTTFHFHSFARGNRLSLVQYLDVGRGD